jgi:hypothetical protein
MARHKVTLRRLVLPILGASWLLMLPGCGGLKLVPVSGTLTLDGKPLTGFGLSFMPDNSKGNNERVGCFSRFDAEGRYEIKAEGVKGSDRGTGAPVGWYKVVLIIDLEGMPKVKPKIDAKYLDVDKTPLAIEVVSNPEPGRYDFKLNN